MNRLSSDCGRKIPKLEATTADFVGLQDTQTKC